jgi:hypothetical protein
MTFAFPQLMCLEVRKIILRTARSIGTYTFRVKMDLESTVLYLNKKDLAAVEIHTKIDHVFGEDTVGYSTVTRYLHKQSFSDFLTVKPRVLTQLTMLFCKRLTNSLLHHIVKLPRGSWFRRQVFDTIW